MKRFLILMVAFLLMQMVYLFADSANDTIWTKMTHNVYYMEFSPNQDYFLTVGKHSQRRGVIIFNTAGDTIKVIYNSEGLDFIMSQGVWDAHFSIDGKYLVVIWEYWKNQVSNGMIEIFETDNWTSIKRIDIPGDSFSLSGSKVLISPDNKIVVGITRDGTYLYDVTSGTLLKRVTNYGQDENKNVVIASAVYSNDGSHIYFTSIDENPYTVGDDKLRFLNTQTYEVDYTIDARASIVAISNSGNMITKIKNLDELQIINPMTKDIMQRIQVQTGAINSIVFSPDEKYLVVNFGPGKVIRVYDIQTGKSIYEYTTVPSGYALGGLSISNDQKYIVSFSGYIFLYKFLPTTGIETPKDLGIDTIYPNPTNGSISINFKLPISGLTHISIYDNTGREIKTIFQGHLEAGEQSINSDIQGLKSGNYFVKVSAVNTNITFKLILNR